MPWKWRSKPHENQGLLWEDCFPSTEVAQEQIEEFLDVDLSAFNQQQRIILLAEAFDFEVQSRFPNYLRKNIINLQKAALLPQKGV